MGTLRARVGGAWVDIPMQGPQGPTGATGPTGPAGAAGSNGNAMILYKAGSTLSPQMTPGTAPGYGIMAVLDGTASTVSLVNGRTYTVHATCCMAGHYVTDYLGLRFYINGALMLTADGMQVVTAGAMMMVPLFGAFTWTGATGTYSCHLGYGVYYGQGQVSGRHDIHPPRYAIYGLP